MPQIVKVFLEHSQCSDSFKRCDVLWQGFCLFDKLIEQICEQVELEVLELLFTLNVVLDEVECV